MSTDRRNRLSEIMNQAWKMVKRNGYTMSEAFGTLKESLIPASSTQGNRKKNDTVQVYYDTEKGEFRSFKIANLVNL